MRRQTRAFAALLGAMLVVGLLATNLPAARLAFALAVCLLLPGFGWARKMRFGDVGDTVAMALVLSICTTVAVGTAMAVSGSWSPEWGLAVLAGIGLAGFVPARSLAARAGAAVRLRRAGFRDDGAARTDWDPRETQQQAKVRWARAAVSASEVSAVRVDWYVERRAEEARAREAAAKLQAIGQWISWCQLTQPLAKRQYPGVDPMRMRCVGGEPAGLLLAILARSTGHEATVYELAPPAESFGWGVVFWDGQLRQLDAHDAETGRLVRENAYTGTDQVIEVEGRDPVRNPSFVYCMRCRRLLALVRSQATEVGVHIEPGRVTDVDAVARSADLVIASDRVNSTLRRQQAGFSTRVAGCEIATSGLGSDRVGSHITQADHRAQLTEILRQRRIVAEALELQRLPHDVVLSERLLARASAMTQATPSSRDAATCEAGPAAGPDHSHWAGWPQRQESLDIRRPPAVRSRLERQHVWATTLASGLHGRGPDRRQDRLALGPCVAAGED